MLENYELFENNIYKSKENRNKTFKYSDGEESEKFLINVLQSTKDLSSNSMELGRKSKDWASFYHLSPRRSNLLRPLKDKLSGKAVLEIGAGCGAITRYLGEVAKSVTAIEGSPTRSYINSLRSQELKNVSIICDNYQDYQTESKFDIATLIGVLEYSRVYFRDHSLIYPDQKGSNKQVLPEVSILKKIHSQLNDSGSVIIAIENKLGLKYLAGYPEDHLGISMAGVEGLYNSDGVVTFGKFELEALLKKSGFENIKFYYPFPDYKVPTSVLCDDLIYYQDEIDLGYILQTSEKVDPQKPEYTTFNMNMVWREIYDNKVWQELSNSFLVIASKSPIIEENLGYHYSIERDVEFQKEIKFTKDKEVIKKPIFSDRNIETKITSSRPFQVNLSNEQYSHGKNWELELIQIMNKPGWNIENLVLWLNTWIECLKTEINYSGKDSIPLNYTFEGKYLDAIPRNLIILHQDQNNYSFIDLEWSYSHNIFFKQLLFRTLFTTVFEQHYVAQPRIDTSYGLNKWNVCKKILIKLGYWVKNQDFIDFFDQELEFQRQISSNYSNPPINKSLFELEFQIKPSLSGAVSAIQCIQFKDQEISAIKKSWSFRIGFYLIHPWKIFGPVLRMLKIRT